MVKTCTLGRHSSGETNTAIRDHAPCSAHTHGAPRCWDEVARSNLGGCHFHRRAGCDRRCREGLVLQPLRGQRHLCRRDIRRRQRRARSQRRSCERRHHGATRSAQRRDDRRSSFRIIEAQALCGDGPNGACTDLQRSPAQCRRCEGRTCLRTCALDPNGYAAQSRSGSAAVKP